MIKDNVAKIKERIAQACSRVNRNPEEITIVAVSKNRTPEEIKEVLDTGIINIGENRVQEALLKYDALRAYELRSLRAIKLHMVGHLQTNKVKEALKLFDLIHSVDSLRLAEELNKQAAKINKTQDILIEIKTSEEAAKFSLKPEEVTEVIKAVAQLKNLRLQGLMTIAPIVDNPEKARPYFRLLRKLKDQLNELTSLGADELKVLSMGMTDDFEVAIEEGASMVRLGRAIFEY